jgi:hypothetical protein
MGVLATALLSGKSHRHQFCVPAQLTCPSTNSVDDLLATEDDDQHVWQTTLAERIEELVDRKRSSVQGREDSLSSYVRILMAHYASKEIEDRISDLLQAFGKSIKAESSERETILALKAVAVTVITQPEDHYYDRISTTLKRTVTDSTSLPTKPEAIHCLGTTAFFGGADDTDTTDAMTFLLDIVSSDGNSVGADNDAATVIAALQEWGLLATEIDDLSEESQDLVEVFADQLDSAHVGVQIAAGENIALLYEKSYVSSTHDDSDSDDENDAAPDADEASFSDDEHQVQHDVPHTKYTVYRNKALLHTKIEGLAKLSTHKLSKKSKRDLHSSFASILATVENPSLGPHYSKALNHETGGHFGSRKVVRLHRSGNMKIDRWWKWIRLGALRRGLQGGFASHYFEGNIAVLECLPVMIMSEEKGERQTPEEKARARAAMRAGARAGKGARSSRGVMGWES